MRTYKQKITIPGIVVKDKRKMVDWISRRYLMGVEEGVIAVIHSQGFRDMQTGASQYADWCGDMLTGSSQYADWRFDMLTSAGLVIYQLAGRRIRVANGPGVPRIRAWETAADRLVRRAGPATVP